MAAPEVRYAIYPGTITLYDGSEVTYTAAELAALYGVDDETYLEVNDETEIPQGKTYFEYIHLKLRKDNIYYDIKDAEHVQEDSLDGQDFDGSRKWVQETKHPYDDLK